MSKIFAVLAVLLCPALVRAQRGGFVVLLGRDTVQVEEFVRTADRIEGAVAFRSPTARLVRYRLELLNGAPARYEQTIFAPDGRKLEPNAANASLTFRADSVTRKTVRANEAVTQQIATPNGATPLLGGSLMIPFAYSFLTYELEFARARAKQTSGETRLHLLGTLPTQATPQATRAWLISADSAEADYFGVARSGFKFDAAGRLLRSDWTGTTYKYKVTRVDRVDAAAIARGWGAQEASGAGFGRYSPRDTARGAVAGVQVWIDYSRPSKRGRVIWGGVVPWDQVWRLGADFATQLHASGDLRIGDTLVPAGKYSLWLVPSSTGALLVVNRQSGQFGTQYDSRQDLARVPMTRVATGNVVEQLTISVREGMLVVAWDDVEYAVRVEAAGSRGQAEQQQLTATDNFEMRFQHFKFEFELPAHR